MKFILLSFLLISIHSSYAQESILVTGSKISKPDAIALLAHHNKVRKDVGIQPLIWSSKLSAYAQEWADHLAKDYNCNMAHRKSPGQDGRTYGENIFWGSSAAEFKPVDASEDWYSEIKQYKYRELTEKNWDATILQQMTSLSLEDQNKTVLISLMKNNKSRIKNKSPRIVCGY